MAPCSRSAPSWAAGTTVCEPPGVVEALARDQVSIVALDGGPVSQRFALGWPTVPVMGTEGREVDALLQRCREVLGDPSGWVTPPGYPDGMALCVIDAVWSIGVKYKGVERVLDRYRAARRDEGGEPSKDNSADLLAVIDAAGGPAAWADALGNRQLTSTRSGVLKAQAVQQATQVLVNHGVQRPSDLAAGAPARLSEVEASWRAVTGQRSGISWRYLLLLAGLPEVKPDRMVVRFVSTAVGRTPDLDSTVGLVRSAAASLGVDVRTLDHRIWRFQSGRR